MITSIELKNWKTHKETRLQFNRGANVIIGVMGAGKSSLMDAMSFALFGTFPALSQKRVSLSGLVMSRPQKESRAEVSLEFEAKGDKYRVTRKIEGSGSSALLQKGADHLQTQPERVNEEITRLLDLDYDTFSRAVYSEQNRLDYFLDLRPGQRKKQIDGMLGLDRFALAEENTTSLINSTRAMIAEEEQMVAHVDIAALKKALDELSTQASQARSSSKSLRAALVEKKAAASILTKEVMAAKGLSARKAKLTTSLAQFESKAATLRQEVEKIERQKIDEAALRAAKANSERKYSLLAKELLSLRDEERKATKQLSEVQERIRALQKDQKERSRLLEFIGEKEKSKLTEKIKANNLELNRTLDIAASSRVSKGEAERFLMELKGHVGRCPICERELDEKMRESLLRSRAGQIAQLEKEIAASDLLIREKRAQISALTEEHNKLSVAQQRLSGYADTEKNLSMESKAAESLKEKASNNSNALKQKEEEKDKMMVAINEAKRGEEAIIRKNGYLAQIQDIDKEALLLSKELQGIKIDDKALYELQDRLGRENSALSEISARLEGTEKLMQSIENQLEGKTKEIASINSMRARIEAKRDMLSNLNKFKIALGEAQASLRNQLVSSINSIMHEMWHQVYPYEDYGDIRLKTQKDDYTLEVSTTPDATPIWLPVDSVASGGERSTACLTMRIALSMVVVPNLRWMILDEPTHNIDSKGIERLVEIISEALPRIVEQIFIITHEERLRNVPSAKVYELERNKAEYGATIVSEL